MSGQPVYLVARKQACQVPENEIREILQKGRGGDDRVQVQVAIITAIDGNQENFVAKHA